MFPYLNQNSNIHCFLKESFVFKHICECLKEMHVILLSYNLQVYRYSYIWTITTTCHSYISDIVSVFLNPGKLTAVQMEKSKSFIQAAVVSIWILASIIKTSNHKIPLGNLA